MAEAETTREDTAAAERRWFQFRLRTLLILTTLIAAWMAWWSFAAQRQRLSVAEIKAARGVVRYDFEENHLTGPAYWTTWMVDGLGIDYFANVTVVTQTGWTVVDADLEPTRWLKSLKELSLRDATITDAGLDQLKGLTSLQSLDLAGTKITDAGLVKLQWLPELRTLELAETSISDAGLKNLNRLKSLEVLYLRNTQITDAGLIQLQELKHLRMLTLGNTRATDSGVERLQKKLPNCTISR